jgi:RNA polymerase sigma-70 factor (ECF subfamily)
MDTDETRQDEWVKAAVDRYAGPLTHYAALITGDLERARDVVQDTFVRLCAEKPCRVNSHLAQWLFTVCRNRALDVVRKKGEASLEDEPQAAETASEEPTPLARHEMTDQLRRLLACLGDLEEERRRLVLLAYYSGWSREQLAEKFETPVNTVKTWLRRSLLQIRECLGS